jgi:hypothetical protein
MDNSRPEVLISYPDAFECQWSDETWYITDGASKYGKQGRCISEPDKGWENIDLAWESAYSILAKQWYANTFPETWRKLADNESYINGLRDAALICGDKANARIGQRAREERTGAYACQKAIEKKIEGLSDQS